MKILNLYAGIGGNRKLWGEEHEVTAVEIEPYIAAEYRRLFPKDTVLEMNAHQYLLDHHQDFDFIWSSPPCPSHSRMNTALYAQGHVRYPDMSLYQEIIFLKQFHKGKWCVENVIPYYNPLIQPTTVFDRHMFWSNFYIPTTKTGRAHNVALATEKDLAEAFDIDISATRNNRKLLRNAVHPLIGLHILKAAQKVQKQEVLL